MDWLTLIAILPLLLIILILFFLKKPLTIAGPIGYIFIVLLAIYAWMMEPIYVFASSLRSVLIAFDITIIIFGAIFFLEFLKETGIVESIESYLTKISPDRRIQAIILAWFMVSFLEGTAGFGTPAAIVAPLMVAIGFPAVIAVALALIGDSVAVVFGAVGTPIRIGFAGLETTGVAFYAGLINLFAGMLVPVMILGVLVYSEKTRHKGAFKEALPFALWAGFCLLAPYFLLTFVGQEFPSLVAPIIGLALLIFTTKKKLFVPKKIMHIGRESKIHIRKKNIWVTLMPYALLVGVLIGAKYVLKAYPVKILGVLNHNINFYNPGILFVLVIIFVAAVLKIKKSVVKESALHALKVLFKPFVAILFLAGLVQIMINSGHNFAGYESMTVVIASIANTSAIPFLAPFIGVFGAFIAGSATVSNLLFGQFQATIALNLGISTAIILALQVVGAGIGNMIALTNVVAAQATVKLQGQETQILKKTALPALIYTVVVGLLGLVLVYII